MLPSSDYNCATVEADSTSVLLSSDHSYDIAKLIGIDSGLTVRAYVWAEYVDLPMCIGGLLLQCTVCPPLRYIIIIYYSHFLILFAVIPTSRPMQVKLMQIYAKLQFHY